MVYLRDCVPDLINALRAAHQHDEPSSPLPDAETLGSLLDVAFGASMEPEEGRFATFGLGLDPPRGPKAPYKEVRFTRPRELCTTEVVRLAAGKQGLDYNIARCWPEPERALHIWGLVTSESQTVGSAPLHGHPTFLLHAPFLVVRARAPGVLYVYDRRQLHLLYVRGTAHFLLSSGRLQEILRDDAHLQPLDANALSQVATRISLLGHGGTLLLTDPEAEVSTDLLDVSYRFDPPSPVLRDAVRAPSSIHDRPAERHALDFVAQLSQVDGAVHLASDLVLRGFGAKIKSSAEVTLMTRDIGSQDAYPISLAAIPGTRHRSAAMFCAQQPGQALANVYSLKTEM